MKKYITALIVGVCLMPNSPAFAEGLNFNFERGEPLEECLRSATKDYLLSSHQYQKINTVVDYKTYLRKTRGSGLNNWRVYRVTTFQEKDGLTVKGYCDSWARYETSNIPTGYILLGVT